MKMELTPLTGHIVVKVHTLPEEPRGGHFMATRRKFSKAFKRQVVEEFLAGGVTQAQQARRYDISPHLIDLPSLNRSSHYVSIWAY